MLNVNPILPPVNNGNADQKNSSSTVLSDDSIFDDWLEIKDNVESMCDSEDKFRMGESYGSRQETAQEYTYELKSQQQLDDLIAQGVQYLANLSDDMLKTYDDLLAGIKYDSNGQMDIEDVGTLKAFLGFKKLVKYQGNLPVTDKRINETTPFLGEYNVEYKDFKTVLKSNPELNNAMQAFYQSIYGDNSASDVIQIIPREKTQEADAIADRFFAEEMEKYGIENPENLFQYWDFNPGVMNICDVDNELNDWCMSVKIQKGGYGTEENFTPEKLALLHEFYHTKQDIPGAKENYDDVLFEMGPTINQLIQADKVYKEIYGINIDDEVKYDLQYDIPSGEKLNPGLIANTFRNIMEKNNFETVEEALISPEGQEFVLNFFN